MHPNYCKEQYEKNKEYCKFNANRYRLANPDKVRESKRLYKLNNKDKVNAYNKKIRDENPKSVRCICLLQVTKPDFYNHLKSDEHKEWMFRAYKGNDILPEYEEIICLCQKRFKFQYMEMHLNSAYHKDLVSRWRFFDLRKNRLLDNWFTDPQCVLKDIDPDLVPTEEEIKLAEKYKNEENQEK